MSDDLTELYIKQQLLKEGVHHSLPGEIREQALELYAQTQEPGNTTLAKETVE
jgi:hypothetical protein